MKQILVKTFFVAAVFLSACKSKPKETEATTAPQAPDTTVMVEQPAPPVTISPDDSLTNALKDATKDFSGVTATAKDGEVVLTGSIERKNLKPLMEILHSIKPKKITNNLTVK